MSIMRFVFLNSNLAFDDEDTRKDRWEKDRFAAFRDVFEKFNSNNCSKHFIPQDYLSIDETLYPMRSQIGFKQFNTRQNGDVWITVQKSK